MDLFDGQDVELVGAPYGDLLRVLSHVDGHPAVALGAAEDAVQEDHHLLRGPMRQLPAEQLLPERVDVGRGDVLDGCRLAERGQQVDLDRARRVADRRPLALPVVLEVAQVLIARGLERDVRRRDVHERVVAGEDSL